MIPDLVDQIPTDRGERPHQRAGERCDGAPQRSNGLENVATARRNLPTGWRTLRRHATTWRIVASCSARPPERAPTPCRDRARDCTGAPPVGTLLGRTKEVAAARWQSLRMRATSCGQWRGDGPAPAKDS